MDQEKDHGAGLIGQAIPTVEETEPRPNKTEAAVKLMMNAGTYAALNELEELITGLDLPHKTSKATKEALFKGVSDLYEGMSQLIKDAAPQ